MEMTINGNLPAFSKDRIERRFSGDWSARNKLPILLQVLTRSCLQVNYYKILNSKYKSMNWEKDKSNPRSFKD